jgi:hypothetical protein
MDADVRYSGASDGTAGDRYGKRRIVGFVDDNGCCWNLYTEKELRSLDGRGADLTIPSAVSNFVGSLVISNFDVIHPVWSGVY